MSTEPSLLAIPAPAGYRVDDLLIDVRSCRVVRSGTDLPISGLSFDLLVRLVSAAPHIVSVDAIMDSVWPGIIVTPEAITQRVKLLRQSLGDGAESPRYFVAVRGRGYRALMTPEPLDAHALEEALKNRGSSDRVAGSDSSLADPTNAAPGTISRAPRIRRGYIGVAALVVVLSGITMWWHATHLPGAQSAAERQVNPGSVTRNSIAVMPFTNLTGEPGKAYLADGMAEELISTLSTVPGLQVSARTSSFAYQGREIDVRHIANDLGVATVLEGSVRSAGDRIRISARLIDAHQGFQIWSQTYDRQFSDLFKLQDDLAIQIMQALRDHFGAALPGIAGRREPAQDLQAYQLYLQAREVSRGDPKTAREAYDLVNQALARDPNFARALAFRAYTEANLVVYGNVPSSWLDDAQRDATRALAMHPGVAEAYAVLGQFYGTHVNWIESEKRFRAGLAANPSDAWLRVGYALGIPMPTGQLQQALAQLREAYAQAPASGFAIHFLAIADTMAGLDADATRLNSLSQQLGGGGSPDWDSILLDTRAAARTGQYQTVSERAVNTLPAALRDAGGAGAIKAFYAAAADPSKRAAAVQALQTFMPALLAARIDGRSKVYFMNLFVMLNALDPAYNLAQQFLDQNPDAPGSGHWTNLWYPEMRPFRQDPRFQALVTRLNFIGYWQQYGPPDGCELNDGKLTCH